MNLTDPKIISAAQEAYAYLAVMDPPRKPWERLKPSAQRKYLIIGKFIVENVQKGKV